MIYDADEVKRMLVNEVERFCGYFLRHGRKYGDSEWRCSDILDSEPGGKSFVVTLKGPKAGLWYENKTGEAGHIIDIIMAQKDIAFGKALDVAKEWLGIREEDRFSPPKKSAPQKKSDISKRDLIPANENCDTWKYLCGERGIKPEIIRKYGVCENAVPIWFRDIQGKEKAIAFPAYTIDSEGESHLANVKYLAIKRTDEGKKLLAQHPMGTNHLIFMNRIPRDAREVVICEGEIDALTMAGAGLNAVSVPAGAHGDRSDGKPHANNEWLTNDYAWLSRFETVYLCFDSDDAGRNAERALFYRIGINRTKVVHIPDVGDPKIKDPNSYARYLAENECDVDAELQKLVKNATALNPETLKFAIQYRQQLYDLMFPKDGEAPGYRLPNCDFGDHFKIRPGEVTVVSGFGGHGKSEFLNDLIVSMCEEYGEKAVIGSFETPPARTLLSMARQISGRRRIVFVDDAGNETVDEKGFDDACQMLNNDVLFYDFVGTAESKKALEAYGLAARMYGVKFFVIDSLMCMDIEEDDSQGQKEFMNLLREFVLKYGVHMFVVAHSRKPTEKKREETYIPWKHDILGSVHISNLAWNVLIPWRNISKGARYQEAVNKMEIAATADQQEYWRKKAEEVFAECDCVVAIRKQRDGTGELPIKELWFDPDSRQYRSKAHYPIRNYLAKYQKRLEQKKEIESEVVDI